MKDLEQNKVGYQFTPIPKHLMHLLDVNCRTMLFSLVDDSNYFTNSEGWFYRSNSDLQNDSKLSKNLVTVTIDTLFRYGIVDVSCVGKGKGKQPNGYRLCAERFPFFEQLNMNTDICRPENQIKTIDYKGSGYSPSYLQDEPLRLKPMLKDGVITWIPINAPNTQTPPNTEESTIDNTKKVTKDITKSDNNIDSIDNKENIDSKNNIEYSECKDNLFNSNKNNIIEEKELEDEETLVRLCEEANSIESQPKEGMNENLNRHQLIENKNLSPTENKKLNKLFNELKWIKDFPSSFHAEPIDDETYNVLMAALKEMAVYTRAQHKTSMERHNSEVKQKHESHTKEQMKPYTKALNDISTVLSEAYSRPAATSKVQS